MRVILFLLTLVVFTGPALAQDYYAGAAYEKLNFKYDRALDRSLDSLSTFYGIEGKGRGLEIGTFVTANATKETAVKTTTRLQGLTLDGFLYTPVYRGAKGFITTGTVIMDVQIEGMGNKTTIFPRAGAGLQYDLTEKISLRAVGRYSDDWSWSFGIRRKF